MARNCGGGDSRLPRESGFYVGSRSRRSARLPPPTINKNNNPSNMLKSVRASCNMLQMPVLESIGILVVAIAVRITHSKGIAASLVNKPRSTIVPKTISTAPTKGAMRCGAGIPTFSNRPTPSAAGKRNF